MSIVEKDSPSAEELKGPIVQAEETAQHAAEKGRAATDKYVFSIRRKIPHFLIHFSRYGKPIVHFDAVAERKLRRKIDLFVMPTVAILFIFGFLDRSNIGTHLLHRFLRFR